MSAKNKPTRIDGLEKHAEALRADLAVPKQTNVFAAAVEAGYLAANADGEVDAGEKAAIVRAIEVLSVGAVIEWEADALVDECAARAKAEGAQKRIAAVGATLKDLGHPEAGLLFAAFVAEASGGLDSGEKKVIEAIGKASGLAPGKIHAVIGKVGKRG